MRLIFSSGKVVDTIMTNESGQVLFKTSHVLTLAASKGTTTIQKIKPSDDPMDMCDQFEVLAEIEWHWVAPSIFRVRDQELKSNVFIRRHGISGRKRTFTGPDGHSYRWDMHPRSLVLSRDDETRTELARYHRRTLGILSPKHSPYLEVQPEGMQMLDWIIITFIFVEKVHKDKQKGG